MELLNALDDVIGRRADLIVAEREFERAKSRARNVGATEEIIDRAIQLVEAAVKGS